MFEKTLIPVAYGEKPEELEKIGKILRTFESQSICLIHVSEGSSFLSDSDDTWLKELKEILEEIGYTVEIRMGHDHIASAIADAALQEGVDEIYIKSKRRWHIETMLLGSIARDLVRLSDIPVFVHKLRPRLPGPEDGVISRLDLIILYATEFDEASIRPIPYLKDFRGARCHIVHIRQRRADPVSEQIQKDDIEKRLRAVEEELGPYYPEVTSEQRVGNPAKEILRIAEEIRADVIVLGRRRRAFLAAPMGETPEMIVIGSKASIFLVP
ncbi:MAG: universal stress protein [Methanocalculus sp. MSAO_Arc2]|uniref:universal stress protein n=1 Tax=Methanocalculus sp. MSAO_Arc2 TaxID=2293855 RepID=UPI000FF00E41|nr:MAG: universal stress protein [Methanocalculus sp. MSAO_Arc2]